MASNNSPAQLLTQQHQHETARRAEHTRIIRIGAVVTLVDTETYEWFADWIRSDAGLLPAKYPRRLLVPRPGAIPHDDPEIPFVDPHHADNPLSEAHMVALDDTLRGMCGADQPCTFARYGGFLSDEGEKLACDRGLAPLSARLRYFVGAAALGECLFLDSVDDELGIFDQSFLWANDRSWFVSSMPDLAFAVIGCGDGLADRLLSSAALGAHEARQES